MSEFRVGSPVSGLMLSRRLARHISQLCLIIVAALFLAVAAYRLTSLWLVPEVTIGVSQTQSDFTKLFAALARLTDGNVVKIRLMAFATEEDVASALDSKKVDFAVARPEFGFPSSGMTAAILQENPMVLITWEATKIKRSAQFAGRRIGSVGMDQGTKATLKRVLATQQAKEVTFIPLDERSEIKPAILAKEVDGVIVSGRPDIVRRYISEIAELKPHIIPLGSTTPNDLPEIGSATIAAKSLPGDIPAEETSTISTSYRLVAGRDADRATVNTILQVLFSQRLALARETDLAWQMKGVPDEEATFAKFPNHRGALDYYNREQQTFMDLYGDWLWLALFAAGGVSSAGAWLAQILSRRRKQLVDNILDRLLEILGEARQAVNIEALDRLTEEIDGLVTHAIRQARWRVTEPMATTAMTLAIDSSRAAIVDRRLALSGSEAKSLSAGDRASSCQEKVPAAFA